MALRHNSCISIFCSYLILNCWTVSINYKYKYPKSKRNEEVKQTMLRHFTLEYWIDGNWYVGRLKEVPGVFSQGESLEELEENIRDAYHLMAEEEIS